MSGKTTNLTPLQIRKQLLVVESELNRAEFVADIEDIKASLAHVAEQLNTMTALAESAMRMGSTFARFFQGDDSAGETGNSHEREKKHSWVSGLFNLAKRGVSFWQDLKGE